MKAKFFLLGLCALALAACSIDEVSQVNDSNAIQFKATASTRAEATTTNNINEFTVWAWNGTNLFMDGVTATKSGSVFTTSPLYFWPTGSVDFYALTEVVEHGIFTGDDDQQHEYALLGGEINVTGDWTYTGNVAKAQVDNGSIVIDACIPSTPEEQIDICYGVALEKSSGSVPMNFRHALSQVAFKAKNVNPAFDVKIADVSVCSVYSEGVYTIGDNDTSDNLASSSVGTSGITDSQGEWAITEKDDADVAIKSRYLVNLESSIVQLDTLGTVEELVDPYGTLMLLPQEVVGWDVLTDAHDGDLGGYIRILCHVEEHGSQLWPNGNEENTSTADNSSFKEIDGEEYAEIAIPLEDIEWEQGYRYTYTIIFGEGLGYYPPDDPNYDLDGTPVLVPITFKVTVDEFQDADGIDIPTDTDLSTITVTTAAELAGAARMGYQEIIVALPSGEESSTITLDGYLEFTHDCTLNIAEGVTITGPDATVSESGDNAIQHSDNTTDYTAIIYVNGCNLTITGDGTVETGGSNDSDYTNAIWVVNGTVTIYGGTYKGSNWSSDSASSNYVKQAVYCGEGGYAYIYAGDFYAGKSTHPSAAAGTDGYAWVLNCHNSSWEEGHAMIYCYGGTYHDGFNPADLHVDDADSYCADGYSTVYDEDNNTYTVVPIVTPTSYADLQAALEDGAPIITIATDIEIADELDFTSDCVLTIEPGVTVGVPEVDDDESGCYGYESSIVKVWNGATVDIYAEGATFATRGGEESIDISAIWVYGGATVNVYGGTYKGGIWTDPNGEKKSGSSATVYAEEGFVNIYDGTFMGGKSGSMQQTSILNCLDSGYKATPRTADIVCYGGTYQNFDPASNNSEDGTRQGLTNFCAEGYTTVQSDEPDDDGFYWWTVVEEN